MPFSLRSFFRKFPIFTWSTSTPPFIIKYRICYLQITRHKARNVVFSLIDTVVYAFFIFSIIQTGICLSKQCVRFLYLINFYIKQLIFFHKSSIITIFISFDCLLLIYSTIFITYSTVCFTKIIYRTLGLLRFNKINKIL